MLSDRMLPLVALIALVSSTSQAATIKPPNPYIDKGACPFECCTYRDWKATKPITLLDKPNGKRSVESFPAGGTVHALTGEVISTPTPVVARRSYADSPIKKGDTFYVLHYEGEGFTLVWFQGKTYGIELSEARVTVEGPPDDRTAWWAQIRTRSGKLGWVRVKDQFENQDACG